MDVAGRAAKSIHECLRYFTIGDQYMPHHTVAKDHAGQRFKDLNLVTCCASAPDDVLVDALFLSRIAYCANLLQRVLQSVLPMTTIFFLPTISVYNIIYGDIFSVYLRLITDLSIELYLHGR